jgi:tetratricopeptide (TPR) repeat protein
MATQPAQPAKQPPMLLGFPRRNVLIILAVLVVAWLFALDSRSLFLKIVMGVITGLLAFAGWWAYKFSQKQKGLMSLLEGAVQSKDARKEAIQKLSQDKDAKDPLNVFARAQLEAADDPEQALKTIESVELKDYPAQIQDDVCLLRAQLYLHFGRHKEALPLAERIDIKNTQRKEMLGTMIAIVSEVKARAGKPAEAIKLLESVDFNKEKEEIRTQLLAARIFARFATNQGVRRDLEELASINPNHLARFILPRFKVHPDLQKQARSVAERNPTIQKMAKAQQQRPTRSGNVKYR